LRLGGGNATRFQGFDIIRDIPGGCPRCRAKSRFMVPKHRSIRNHRFEIHLSNRFPEARGGRSQAAFPMPVPVSTAQVKASRGLRSLLHPPRIRLGAEPQVQIARRIAQMAVSQRTACWGKSSLTPPSYNNNDVIMLPRFVSIAGVPWRVLPPGVHPATLAEIEQHHAYNVERYRLFRGLADASVNLQKAGCRFLYLDGSFVTDKPIPGDFDACWDPEGVSPQKLHPVFFRFDDRRAAQKAKFGGEFSHRRRVRTHKVGPTSSSSKSRSSPAYPRGSC